MLLRLKQKQLKASSESKLSESDNNGALIKANIIFIDKDRAYIYIDPSQAIPHTYQGVLDMQKLVMFAETEEAFKAAQLKLCEEFNDQRPIL